MLVLVLPIAVNNTEEDTDTFDFDNADDNFDADDEEGGVVVEGWARKVCIAKSGNLVTISSKTFEATRLFLRLTKRSNACCKPVDKACVHVIVESVSVAVLTLPLAAAADDDDDDDGGSERAMLLAARMRHNNILRATVDDDGVVVM